MISLTKSSEAPSVSAQLNFFGRSASLVEVSYITRSTYYVDRPGILVNIFKTMLQNANQKLVKRRACLAPWTATFASRRKLSSEEIVRTRNAHTEAASTHAPGDGPPMSLCFSSRPVQSMQAAIDDVAHLASMAFVSTKRTRSSNIARTRGIMQGKGMGHNGKTHFFLIIYCRPDTKVTKTMRIAYGVDRDGGEWPSVVWCGLLLEKGKF
jgi:hypothetical protein